MGTVGSDGYERSTDRVKIQDGLLRKKNARWVDGWAGNRLVIQICIYQGPTTTRRGDEEKFYGTFY